MSGSQGKSEYNMTYVAMEQLGLLCGGKLPCLERAHWFVRKGQAAKGIGFLQLFRIVFAHGYVNKASETHHLYV